jgi:hypothetical protein
LAVSTKIGLTESQGSKCHSVAIFYGNTHTCAQGFHGWAAR